MAYSLISCQEGSFLIPQEAEEEQVQEQETGYEGVDEALWEYFERFEEEGKKRGFSIDLREEQITGAIQEIDEQHVAGICSYSSYQPNKVTIDSDFWERGSDRFKEFIVFHELGHCYLNRDHSENTLSNGACASIMRSGNGGCRDNYRSETREFYLNELYQFGDLP